MKGHPAATLGSRMYPWYGRSALRRQSRPMKTLGLVLAFAGGGLVSTGCAGHKAAAAVSGQHQRQGTATSTSPPRTTSRSRRTTFTASGKPDVWVYTVTSPGRLGQAGPATGPQGGRPQRRRQGGHRLLVRRRRPGHEGDAGPRLRREGRRHALLREGQEGPLREGPRRRRPRRHLELLRRQREARPQGARREGDRQGRTTGSTGRTASSTGSARTWTATARSIRWTEGRRGHAAGK